LAAQADFFAGITMMNKNGEKTVARIIALEEAFLHPKLRELYPAASYIQLLDMLMTPALTQDGWP
jgi:hypothetical protein